MDKFEIIVTTLFGVEAITANEIRKLGYPTTNVSDGRITFLGDLMAVCRANMWIRTGERVLIKIGEFKAVTFDELFDQTANIKWSDWLPKDCAFPVKGFTFKSTLFSMSDCQSIIKKSVVKSLSGTYKSDWFSEVGETYQIEFSIIRDTVTLMIDTSGMGLHKRGYRKNANLAPIKETLAATMAILSHFRYDGVLADPFCGSGTIPIEAGLIAKNIAPGLNRDFAFMNLRQFSKKLWEDAKAEAMDLIKNDTKIEILASDIDKDAVELTVQNSKIAGVSDVIYTSVKPISEWTCDKSNGTMICNPPYGERLLEEKECEVIYRQLGNTYKKLDNWSLYTITPNENFEQIFGKFANKKRKLYNGMIKCNLYQYFPEKK
jgi:putative N6-adenine-specific DNA methylase